MIFGAFTLKPCSWLTSVNEPPGLSSSIKVLIASSVNRAESSQKTYCEMELVNVSISALLTRIHLRWIFIP